MPPLRGSLLVAALLASACTRVEPPPAAPPQTVEAHRAAVEQGRRDHEASYRRNYVTIAGLHPLNEGVTSAGSAPDQQIQLPPPTPPVLGRFLVTGARVRFEPHTDARVLLNGQPLTAARELTDDGGEAAPDELAVGDVRMVVHSNGTTRSLRVRDPNGPMAKGFLGFTWFDVNPAAKVRGRFIRDASPRTLQVVNTYGEVNDFETDGVVEFTWEGQVLRLRPFKSDGRRYFFVFRDASSGDETYEAARFLYADLGDTGTMELEFNLAYNPPCAFNMYTTCPIPLPENRLPVKILAGEKKYPVKVPFLKSGS